MPSTKNKPTDLIQFGFVKSEVTGFLKSLKINLENNSKCYAVGQLNYHNQLLLLYLEVFKLPEETTYEYVIKITSFRSESDKSLLYLASDFYRTVKKDDGKSYIQHDQLSSEIFIKDKKLYLNSKIQLIDDLILEGMAKTKRTKNVTDEFTNVLAENEFEEVSIY